MLRVREAVVRYRALREVDEKISQPHMVDRFFRKMVNGEPREVFFSLMLNSRNRVVCFERVAVGTSSACLVDVKAIVRSALLVGAESLIMVHNHPSGDPSPSQEDEDLTRKIVGACKMMGIGVLDHVVIGEKDYVSLRERGFDF